ncbi:VOC family protein [Jeotgalibacillus proteolyticus]|uniref:Glyoxalase/bleomycin resistance/dioxygenase family protein n=1 Tax=Jeotgalibacillus proteolyticus TaxID=2082395 RepID=A0A2S5GD09_9BACL|nr:VOC family protein [Jeotgalibacillus proteolyticus]PPA70805.1 glyoxalase/bleomycin resistance/dioxygenase family protein [Jeotgalibacillus proteolyticus]
MKQHHAGIQVKNLFQSELFYVRNFGFIRETLFRLGSEKIIFLRKDDVRLEIIEDNEFISCSCCSHTHFAWEVEGLDELMAALNEAGLQIEEGPFTLANGWKTVFYLGPDQELIELVEAKVKDDKLTSFPL